MNEPTERLSAALADRYKIISRLGEGGMAIVYLADDLKHNRKVALKVLKPELAAVLGAERFVHEIRTTASLQHPHILPLFDSCETDGCLYYVMPYIEGETLRQKLDRETQLSIEEAVRITTGVADALDYAHRQGVIHRDIKPENILLHDGRPMVADFGIALAVSAAAGGRMTETGLSLGTPHYMSPEQATADKDLTAKSDIYSLGAMLYEMLTGDPPHTGSSAQQIIMRIVTEAPRDVTEARKSVPPNVADATARALEKLPADRFSSASEFSAALVDRTFTNLTRSSTRASQVPVRSYSRGLVAVTLIAIVLAAWGWLREPPEGSSSAGVPFTFDFQLPTEQRISTGMDQPLFHISDNGETIAWLGDADEGFRRIYYRSTGNLEVRPVPGVNAAGGFWLQLSPEGRSVSYLSNGQLMTIALDGSSEAQRVFDGGLWSWSWNEDGSFTVAEPYRGLSHVPRPGADPVPLTRLEEGEVTHQFPRELPDGRGFLFSVGIKHFWSSRVEALVPDGDQYRRVEILDDAYLASYVEPGYLVFGRGRDVMAVPFDLDELTVTGPERILASGIATDRLFGFVTQYTVSETGTLVRIVPDSGATDELAWLDRDGTIDPIDIPIEGSLVSPELSPDGGSLAVIATTAQEQWPGVYVIDLDRQVARRFSTTFSQDVHWSADGADLLFSSTRDGYLNVYQSPLAQPDRIARVTDAAFDHHPSQWTSRGTVVITERLPFDHQRILIGPSSDPGTIRPVTDNTESASCGHLSPDEEWLAYHSNGHVFIRSMNEDGTAGDVLEQVSSTASGEGVCRRPMWSRDGSRLYYVRDDMGSIMQVAVRTSPRLVVGKEEDWNVPANINASFFFGFNIGADGRALIVTRHVPSSQMRVIVTLDALNLLAE